MEIYRAETLRGCPFDARARFPTLDWAEYCKSPWETGDPFEAADFHNLQRIIDCAMDAMQRRC